MDVVLRRGGLLERPVGALVVGVLQRERKLAGVIAAVDRARLAAAAGMRRARDLRAGCAGRRRRCWRAT